ncbi:hypothetical protein B0H67DRAFT_256659 [Lasiosphaeris hirsuta]|uniref:Uncharacterized protein n=1 Tax=Lasiosphaeris hirsuta TaxID=260670 RepID=A0AA40AHU0_9PEZI|nr:hypothetical protein B0H67DRAFT_256659 [Lasiosphaeris hirsuta]
MTPDSPAFTNGLLLILISISVGIVLGQDDDDDGEGLRFCFGTDSICVASNDMSSACRDEEDAHGSDAYWQCACLSGYAAVNDACDECQISYGMKNSSIIDWDDSCSDKGLSVAPIPSSIIAQQSSRNATYVAHAAEVPKTTVTYKAIPTEPLPTVATTAINPLSPTLQSKSTVTRTLWGLGTGIAVGMMVLAFNA